MTRSSSSARRAIGADSTVTCAPAKLLEVDAEGARRADAPARLVVAEDHRAVHRAHPADRLAQRAVERVGRARRPRRARAARRTSRARRCGRRASVLGAHRDATPGRRPSIASPGAGAAQALARRVARRPAPSSARGTRRRACRARRPARSGSRPPIRPRSRGRRRRSRSARPRRPRSGRRARGRRAARAGGDAQPPTAARELVERELLGASSAAPRGARPPGSASHGCQPTDRHVVGAAWPRRRRGDRERRRRALDRASRRCGTGTRAGRRGGRCRASRRPGGERRRRRRRRPSPPPRRTRRGSRLGLGRGRSRAPAISTARPSGRWRVEQAVGPRVQQREPERLARAPPRVQPAAPDEQLLAAVAQRQPTSGGGDEVASARPGEHDGLQPDVGVAPAMIGTRPSDARSPGEGPVRRGGVPCAGCGRPDW